MHSPSHESSIKGKWTLQEDEQLTEAVSKWNGKSWNKISESMSGRDENECFVRWYEKLRPTFSRVHWEKEEDHLLDVGVAKFGVRNWEAVAETIKNHTAIHCMLRYHENLNPELG